MSLGRGLLGMKAVAGASSNSVVRFLSLDFSFRTAAYEKLHAELADQIENALALAPQIAAALLTSTKLLADTKTGILQG